MRFQKAALSGGRAWCGQEGRNGPNGPKPTP